MKSKEFLEKAKSLVVEYFNELHDKSMDSATMIGENDVFVVWFNYTLGNMKGLFSTTVPDGMYYEITYDPRCNKIYFDAYKKFHHKAVDVD